MMQFGIQIGWISPNIARLTHNNSFITLTPTEASWLVSCATLGSLLGAIVGLIFMGLIGNRKTILLILVLISISWLCLIIAESAMWIYISRFLSGITSAMTLSCFSIFLAEVTVPKIRGTLISIASSGNPFGIIFGLITETYLPMKISSTIYLCQCLITIVLFLCLYDSPQYFIKMNKFEKASKSITFYGIDSNIEHESLESNVFMQNKDTKNIKNNFMEFKHPVVKKTILVIIVLFALPHLCGILTIMSYMEIILNVGKFNLINSDKCVIYANIISVIVSISTFTLNDKFGRRILLIISSVGTILSLFALGIYFYLLHKEFDVSYLQWLLIVSINIHLISCSIGFTKVPSIILSEIFSDKIKNVGACISTLSGCFFAFLTTKSYQPLVDTLGEEYVFWIYAGLTIIGTVWVVILLPETKGKSLQQIQNELMKRKSPL
ncbi:PREDICTED: facilitated trehalose transporter Tret1-like [Ceratosolen solmsi marchali]|uniref:Facilitated trehalose transporter Tret1-like n=1 Tax=Ceratosolen solmsi marchali TaxID=326594 RepID=A0AAJ6YK93_9HYME|nr:PREDICTED: facilitated trehalose transporter Tret1-like [Ceratosolen solmsi marchali]